MLGFYGILTKSLTQAARAPSQVESVEVKKGCSWKRWVEATVALRGGPRPPQKDPPLGRAPSQAEMLR